jgi:hypothetical protein
MTDHTDHTDHTARAERCLADADLDGLHLHGDSLDQAMIAIAQVRATIGRGHAILALAHHFR